MRTKTNKIQTNEDITLRGSLTNRFGLASLMGVSFNGNRNLYSTFGYKTDLTFSDFATQYARQDMAAAIIDRPVNRTWQGDVLIIESDDDKETPLETVWVELEDELKIKSKLIRLDKLTGIGRYGILLLGFSDGLELSEPVQKSSSLKLAYIKPLAENSAVVNAFEIDQTNPRYGQPLLYNISTGNADGSNTSTVQVHYSRIIHVVDSPLDSEVSSSSRLEVVFNRLTDLEKLVGGSAEMFWKGARPGYSGTVDKDFTLGVTEKAAIDDQMTEYEHNLRRILMMKGIDLKALESQVSDPKSHVEIQLQMISAAKNIPVRVLIGSERGELSSGQDADEWNAHITGRRKEFAEPCIVRPLVDRLIDFGVLPKPSKRYNVQWEDLYTQSDKEKAELGKTRATTLKEYASVPAAEAIVPPAAFMEFFLGLNADQITLIQQMQEDFMAEEQKRIEEEAIEEENSPELDEDLNDQGDEKGNIPLEEKTSKNGLNDNEYSSRGLNG